MKAFAKKVSSIFRVVFGYGILACLFAGGMTFFGYLAAMIIGGETAEKICVFLYEDFLPVVIYASTILVVLGLIVMYLNGEKALTTNKKKNVKHKGEL